MSSSQIHTLWKVIEKLNQASVPYMLTGSMALNFYGSARATNDIDIVIQIDVNSVKMVCNLFKDNFYLNEEAVRDAIHHQTLFNIIDQESVFKVDFIILKKDDWSQEKFDRRTKVSVEKHDFFIISPEDLILSKLEWSKESLSEIQRKDIVNIFQICENTLDKNYIFRKAEQIGQKERLNEIYDSSRHKS